jgi:AcrR family transcriptional regulator
MSGQSDSTGGLQRRWRGRDPADRVAGRRARLLDAGIELMGTQGSQSVSMRGVCRQAALSERYFYESFAELDDLRVAVLETVVLQARDVLREALDTAPSQPAELIRHEVRAFTSFLLDDPRRGRVIFVESQASPSLIRRRDELVQEFTTPIEMMFGPGGLTGEDPDGDDVALNAVAVFGALAYLYQKWLSPRHTSVSEQRFVEHTARVIERIATVTSAG